MITRDTLLGMASEATQQNRHTTATYLAARAFGYRDLCKDLARIYALHGRRRGIAETEDSQRYALFNELRRRVLTAEGEDVWRAVRM